MAIEHGAFKLIQERMIKASQLSRQRTDMLNAGQVDNAAAIQQEHSVLIAQIRVLAGIMPQLQEAGIEDLPIQDFIADLAPDLGIKPSGNGHSPEATKIPSPRPFTEPNGNATHSGRKPEVKIESGKGATTARIGYAALALNEAGDAFLRPNLSDVVTDAYAEELAGFSESEKQKIVRNKLSNTHTIIANLFTTVRDPDRKNVMGTVKDTADWIRKHPLMEKLSNEELEKLAQRRTGISEIYEKAGLKEPKIDPSKPKKGAARSVRQTRAKEPREQAGTHEDERLSFDFSPKEKEVAHAYTAINENRTGFAHNTLAQVAEVLYPDIAKMDPAKRSRQLHSKTGSVVEFRKRVTEKLTIALTSQRETPEIREFLEYLKTIPEYANLQPEQIPVVIKREISFDELKAANGANPKGGVQGEGQDGIGLGTGEGAEGDGADEGSDPNPDGEPTPLSLADIFAQVKAQVAEEGLEIDKNYDLSPVQIRIAIEALAIKDDRTGFVHEREQDIIGVINESALAGANDKTRQRRIENFTRSYERDVDDIINFIEFSKESRTFKTPYVKALNQWIAQQPELEQLKPLELKRVMTRKLHFKELQRRLTTTPLAPRGIVFEAAVA